MNYVVILAAGNGSRLSNSTKPKQFIEIDGKSILSRVIEFFSCLDVVDSIVVVSQKNFFPLTNKGISKLKPTKPIFLVEGGSTRQLSSLSALEFLSKKAQSSDCIAIHDSARVLVSKSIVENGFKSLKTFRASTTAIKTIDSLINSQNGESIDQYVDKKPFYQIQTPQFFQFETILHAHLEAKQLGIIDAPDDASLVTKMGIKVALIKGDPLNFKVTTPEDLFLLEKILIGNKIHE